MKGDIFVEIVVVVGQVPATGISIEYDRRLNSVDPDDILYIPSRCDMQAVEEAIRIRDSQGEGTITLIAIGPQRVEAALRAYLSMGADVAIHICDWSLENSDAYGLSLALSDAIRSIKYDLILCSELVDDSGCTIFLAPYIAEMLGLPQVSGVTKVELQAKKKKVIVHRKIEGGERELILAPLPCLLGVEEGINEPRYPTFPDSLASIRKGIQVVDLTSLRLKASQVGSYGSFVKVVRFSPPRGRIKKGLSIDTKLSAAERMKIIKSGELSSRSGQFLTGEPNKLAEEIALILERQGEA